MEVCWEACGGFALRERGVGRVTFRRVRRSRRKADSFQLRCPPCEEACGFLLSEKLLTVFYGSL